LFNTSPPPPPLLAWIMIEHCCALFFVVAMLAATLFAAYAVAWINAPHHRIGKLLRNCGLPEEGVDYLVDLQLYKTERAPNSDQCREHCDRDPACGAWTWEELENGRPIGRCSMGRLEGGQTPRKQEKPGAISGLSCQVRPPQFMPNRGPSGDAQGREKDSGVAATEKVATTTAAATTTKATTTTPAATTTTTIATTVDDKTGMLYCFALMLPYSYEQSLMELQHQEKASLFACDEFAIYSNKEIEVVPGVKTSVVKSDLKAKVGGKYRTALNTDVFIAVWLKVVEDEQYLRSKWTVKVDPDTVFFPDRLRTVLESHPEASNGVYINNCKYGLHGPLEIFSRNAVKAWYKGLDHCKNHFNEVCHGPCQYGEDWYVDQCLWKVLGVKREDEFGILVEEHCDPPDEWEKCEDTAFAAFHPFKTMAGYYKCLSSSRSVKA